MRCLKNNLIRKNLFKPNRLLSFIRFDTVAFGIRSVANILIFITLSLLCIVAYSQNRDVVWVHGFTADASAWQHYATIFTQERKINSKQWTINTTSGLGSASYQFSRMLDINKRTWVWNPIYAQELKGVLPGNRYTIDYANHNEVLNMSNSKLPNGQPNDGTRNRLNEIFNRQSTDWFYTQTKP